MAAVTTKDAVIRGYAEALFAVADAEGDLDKVEGELYAFAKAIEANPELREALTDPALPVERKQAVIGDVLGDKTNPSTANLLGLLVEQGRARELQRIIEQLAQIAAERRQSSLAEVRTAVELDAKQKAALRDALSAAVGRSVEVKVVVDPSVIGGVVARVGDEVIDGSIRTRLEEANAQLKGA
ncbi:MAG: ATP synthase F1 subunit delta [Actinomycetota bacterium]